MCRKESSAGDKKEQITKEALKLFFEKGYDATSVRGIMKAVGSEVGLFYYYFKNKDACFDSVLDLFFSRYEADFARIVSNGRRNPCRVMADFFEYMEQETEKFRQQYADNIHKTVRWAISEHTLDIIEPYLKEAVEIQSAYYGVKPPIGAEAAALYLTHGAGSAILHENRKTHSAPRTKTKRGISLLMGMPLDDPELRVPYPAQKDDIPGWMTLLSSVKENFPGLDAVSYLCALQKRIADGEGWVFRYDGKIPAALLYSKERKEIDFLAVSPAFRRKGLASKLIETAAAQFPVGTTLSVITYRPDDPLGKAALPFYTALGFLPGEEMTLFDYPCRKFAMTVTDGPPIRRSSDCKNTKEPS